MTSAPVLDTHAWIWWLDRDSRLPAATILALDALPANDRPMLCDISLWEVAMLVERKRLTFSLPFAEWLSAAAHPRTVRVQSITPDIAIEVSRLPSSFHRDPADRLIVATSRVLGAPLVSQDQLIVGSRLAKAWRPAPNRPRR